jgi:large subunit ribosomal protein L6
MSRIGKLPIKVLQGVEVKLNNGSISVKGSKGQLNRDIPTGIKVTQEGDLLSVTPVNRDRNSRCLHGLIRTLINNMVIGVSTGYTRELEINGVGYRANVKGKVIDFSLGYSHPINFSLPDGITAELDKAKKNILRLSGYDKELLGQVAAKIRDLRSPEPYKGKGIKYVEETIRRKAGKSAAGGAK